MDFSKWLKFLRANKNFSQTGLADYLGIHYKTVAAWENGTQKPQNAQLRKVSFQTGESFLNLWIMSNPNSPFVVPVYVCDNLKKPIYRLLANTNDEKAFWILIDKKLEKQTSCAFKEGDLILIEPSAFVVEDNFIFHNGKIKKAGSKSNGFKITFRLSRL